jgi:hypothetical protein
MLFIWFSPESLNNRTNPLIQIWVFTSCAYVDLQLSVYSLDALWRRIRPLFGLSGLTIYHFSAPIFFARPRAEVYFFCSVTEVQVLLFLFLL